MQPFEKHPANPGELQAYGEHLIAEGAQSLQLGRSTRAAYQPAVDAVQGVPAPAVAAAPYPVDQRSQATAGALVWGAVATQFWGDQVGKFNTKVDQIVAEMEAEEAAIIARYDAQAAPGAVSGGGQTPPGQTQNPQDTAEALERIGATMRAREKWEQAHDEHIEAGGARAAAMLQQGPTADNMQAMRQAGFMPALSHKQNLLDQIDLRFLARHWAVLPYGQGNLGPGLYGVERGLNIVAVGEYLGKVHSQTFVPRTANRLLPRHPSTPDGRLGKLMSFDEWRRATPFLDRVRAVNDSKNWVPKSVEAAKDKAWLKNVGRWTKFGGAGVSAASGAVDQWHRDAGRTDLDTGDKAARSGVRAAAAGAGSLAGVWAGVKLGAAAGAFTLNPIGIVGGAIVGGIVGGVAGSAAGNWAADRALYDDGQGPDLSDPDRPGIGGV